MLIGSASASSGSVLEPAGTGSVKGAASAVLSQKPPRQPLHYQNLATKPNTYLKRYRIQNQVQGPQIEQWDERQTPSCRIKEFALFSLLKKIKITELIIAITHMVLKMEKMF